MVNATIVPKLFLATIVFHCLDSILTRPFLAICSLFFLFGLQKEPNGSKQRHLRQANAWMYLSSGEVKKNLN
jgi:hypothetical protein